MIIRFCIINLSSTASYKRTLYDTPHSPSPVQLERYRYRDIRLEDDRRVSRVDRLYRSVHLEILPQVDDRQYQ
jgi:hypothetical protein